MEAQADFRPPRRSPSRVALLGAPAVRTLSLFPLVLHALRAAPTGKNALSRRMDHAFTWYRLP